jgi:hypothetical protein
MSALPQPAREPYVLDLASTVHLLNVYCFEFRMQDIDAPHVMAYRVCAGWQVVNRWSNGSEFIEDYATDAELLTALDARLRRVQAEARTLRAEVGA